MFRCTIAPIFGFALGVALLAFGNTTAPAAAPQGQPPPDIANRLARPAPGRMDWFQDLKFGLFLHWGVYSELGCIESWPLVYADRSWSNPEIKTLEEMLAFREKYWALNKKFNPTKFHPEDWAEAAKRAGMRYVMFTTKHHDGFCMYDTRQTNFRVTAPDCPFSRHARANIAKEVFDVFRKEGFGIGCYFSKSDWHHPGYWSPDSVPLDRNPNYDTLKQPERWKKFRRFVHGQVEELLTGYGHIDILWLDGGQVRPPKQDIRMSELVAMARGHQPHLIVVDRTVGTFEDYRTPEQRVPEKPLSYVWESCLTMGTQWSYKPNDEYKTPRELVHLLIDIVAKGGNMLLNIGPRPDGTLPQVAVARLDAIGRWMDVNGEAIHGTRPMAPYKEGQVALTRKGDVVYAIYLAQADEVAPPAKISVPSLKPRSDAKIHLLGVHDKCDWQLGDNGLVIHVPSAAQVTPPCHHAWVFKVPQGSLQDR
jgi:alpha-L-fucosidase